MTDWSKHVHRFAKKHNMSYKQANVSKKCKEAYKKRKTSPRKKSPLRKKRMNPPKTDAEKIKKQDRLDEAREIAKNFEAFHAEREPYRRRAMENLDTPRSSEYIREFVKMDKALRKKYGLELD